MRPYVFGMMHQDDVEVFDKVRKAVLLLPDEIDFGLDEKEEPIILSCHILARAVARAFSLKFKDGYFCFHWQHSWIVAPHFNIIDVYPVAILGGPIMVSWDFGSPRKMLYQALPTKVVYKNKFKQPSFLMAVEIVYSLLKNNY